MKILILTQVVDINHPILGFFHRWLEEFAKNCEQVSVICLQKGEYNLPDNVAVYSLGKENGDSKVSYLVNFYKLIWKLRDEYSGVFVHMNQIYVILGAPFWRAAGKRIGLWYMHGSVSTSLRIAEKLTNKIFTGSPESFRLRSKKIVVTGHGIDVDRFSPQSTVKDIDLITVGRITESKNLLTLIDVLKELRSENQVTLSIIGISVTEEEIQYKKKLEIHIDNLGLKESVKFLGKIPQVELPQYLNRAKIFVTVAQNGSLDKAVLEAMACGLPVVSMAPGTASLSLRENQVSNQSNFTTQVRSVLELRKFSNQENIHVVTESHSIKTLIPKIISIY